MCCFAVILTYFLYQYTLSMIVRISFLGHKMASVALHAGARALRLLVLGMASRGWLRGSAVGQLAAFMVDYDLLGGWAVGIQWSLTSESAVVLCSYMGTIGRRLDLGRIWPPRKQSYEYLEASTGAGHAASVPEASLV